MPREFISSRASIQYLSPRALACHDIFMPGNHGLRLQLFFHNLPRGCFVKNYTQLRALRAMPAGSESARGTKEMPAGRPSERPQGARFHCLKLLRQMLGKDVDTRVHALNAQSDDLGFNWAHAALYRIRVVPFAGTDNNKKMPATWTQATQQFALRDVFDGNCP